MATSDSVSNLDSNSNESSGDPNGSKSNGSNRLLDLDLLLLIGRCPLCLFGLLLLMGSLSDVVSVLWILFLFLFLFLSQGLPLRCEFRRRFFAFLNFLCSNLVSERNGQRRKKELFGLHHTKRTHCGEVLLHLKSRPDVGKTVKCNKLLF